MRYAGAFLLGAAGLLLAAGPGSADPASPDASARPQRTERTERARPGDPALAARIFQALGVREQIAAIVPAASAQVRGARGAPETDRRALDRIVARGFAPDRLERASQHAFLARLDLDRARSAARSLADPALQRVHRAHRAAARASCTCVDGSDERARIIEGLDRAIDESARSQAHAATVVINMQAAARALLPHLPEAQLMGRIDAAPAEPAPSPAQAACRYAALSTEDLRAALRFVESDTGRWLYDAVSRGVDAALGAAARRTARELIQRFEGREPTPALRTARGSVPAIAVPTS